MIIVPQTYRILVNIVSFSMSAFEKVIVLMTKVLFNTAIPFLSVIYFLYLFIIIFFHFLVCIVDAQIVWITQITILTFHSRSSKLADDII